jgi:phosphoglycerate dehydrogenase-like enzyme
MSGAQMAASPRSDRATAIVVGQVLSSGHRDRIEAAGGHVLLDDAAAHPDGALAVVPDAEVWFGVGLGPALLAAAAKLRWLQTANVGAEYGLFPELVSSDVVVTTVRQRHWPTSEHALALMLAIARAVPQVVRQQQARRWERVAFDQVLTLRGAHLLVVGTGQIGGGVATRAAAFGMVVDGCSRSGEPRPAFRRVFPTRELAAAARSADWIVNCAPLTTESLGLFSEEVFAATKPGVVFVNVGRGKTVDQDALRRRLRSGHVRAAALDVFAQEPLPADDELWAMPNVLITPHAAGVNPNGDAWSLGVDSFVENLARYRAGQPLIEPVDKALGY